MNQKKSFGVWSATFLGIGAMVGAGIFALLGEASAIAGNLVFISFIIGGFIALLSGYSFAKLSVKYPSRGGIVEYLTQLYGENIFSGSISVLLYIAALVSIAMVAKTFGIYAENIFGLNSQGYSHYIFSISILLFFMIINLSGSYLTAKFENLIVFFKLAVLFIFSAVAIYFINPNYLKMDFPINPINPIFAIGLTFFAYEGFRVITNTVEDMENPNKNIIKSMNYSILIVMGLYLLISFAVFGNLSLGEIDKAKEYVLAQAAKSFFGEFGFIILGITALISTASAINANLYAVSNITYTMAKEGELPKEYKYNVWHNYEGLIISTFFLILLVLFFNLAEIAVIGSISILIIHLIVHFGHIFHYKKTKANLYLLILSVSSILFAIIVSLIYSYQYMPNIILYLLLAFVISFFTELILRILQNRVIKKQISKN